MICKLREIIFGPFQQPFDNFKINPHTYFKKLRGTNCSRVFSDRNIGYGIK